jgi:chromosome segregation protein
MRGQHDASSSELSRFQLKHSEVNMKINELSQRLTQEFGISLEDALKKYPEKENESPFDDQVIARLQRRIENLGPINMAAPEEYETLSEREKFLKTQHKDVEQAIADLEKFIAELDGTARTKFVESFEKVRRNFQKVFNDLFEGGTSDLILTQSEDPLSAGVEIIAQPPGKKLQSITLLSAGEQTLCAIALLFAFFMTRPSPFSVLDEIDSPLDDSNVRRFANLLNQFSNQTQFLVVTHNKNTMEVADRMFGITMEEFGVSKLISVRLHREGAVA